VRGERVDKQIRIVSEARKVRLLLDPANAQILRHLAEGEMTQKMLAGRLGVSDPTVSYHLKELRSAAFVKLVRTEPESHGIIQKFYRATALHFVADYPKMPPDMKRRLVAANVERLRGGLAVMHALRGWGVSLSSVEMDSLADRLARSVVQVARDRRDNVQPEEREKMIIDLYGDALRMVLESVSDSFFSKPPGPLDAEHVLGPAREQP
jgi:DNA-binding transcriptional ArsR family regulator